MQGLPVVFDGVEGFKGDVGVVEGAAELGGDGFGVGGEVAEDVGLVYVVCVDEEADAGEDSGSEGCQMMRDLFSLMQ